MLEGGRLAHGIPDILSRDLNVAVGFVRVVKKDSVADDVGLAWGEIAPAFEADKGVTISCLGWDEESEDDAGEDCY